MWRDRIKRRKKRVVPEYVQLAAAEASGLDFWWIAARDLGMSRPDCDQALALIARHFVRDGLRDPGVSPKLGRLADALDLAATKREAMRAVALYKGMIKA